MLNQSKIDALLEDFMRLIPDDVHRARADLEHNIRASLHAAFARMDLVTREEYDIQAELLPVFIFIHLTLQLLTDKIA